MHCLVAAGARAPHALAVDDEHGQVGGGGHARQGGGVQAGQHPSDGGRRWGGAHSGFGAGEAGSQPGQGVLGCVGRPLADRGQGAGPGQHRAQADQNDAAQSVAAAPPVARISLLLCGREQGGGGPGRLGVQRSPCEARGVEVPDLLPGLRCHVQGTFLALTHSCDWERCCPSPTLQHPCADRGPKGCIVQDARSEASNAGVGQRRSQPAGAMDSLDPPQVRAKHDCSVRTGPPRSDLSHCTSVFASQRH